MEQATSTPIAARQGSRQAAVRTVRRQQSNPIATLLRRLVSRDAIDERIDLARLRLDSFPHGRYQPIDVLPGRAIKRADGSLTRWEAIRPVVSELGVRSAVDVGANEGFFAIELGRMGIPTAAVESAPTAYRTAQLAVRRAGLSNVGVLTLEVGADTASLVPHADSTVFLSLWHHFVKFNGLETATAITRQLWDGTGHVMFFDTGENEMDASFGLPTMEPEARSWLGNYLADTCPGSAVRHLGRHAAFDAAGEPCERNLFAVVRVAST